MFEYYKKNKIEIKDIRGEYEKLINRFGYNPNVKLILNKQYSYYFGNLLKEMLWCYESLEIKVLDDNILYQYQELSRGI